MPTGGDARRQGRRFDAEQFSYVVAALSERRDLNKENAEPVEEILAKAALVDLLLQVPIGCGALIGGTIDG